MQKEEYLIKNACYSVTKYYLCRQNNKRSLLGRKQQSQVARSFPNRYLFCSFGEVTYLFSNRYILTIILHCKNPLFGVQKVGFCIAKVWFLFFECCVVAICLECYRNPSATFWQSVSSRRGRFIAPAYTYTPTK